MSFEGNNNNAPALEPKIEVLPETNYVFAVTRRSRPRMTRFERARILSMRAEQVANGTVPFVDRIEGDQPLDIAEREFAAGRIPFMIRRFIPTTDKGIVSEDWRLDELGNVTGLFFLKN